MAKRKSVVLSLVLTFFLGPFGMLYSTVPGALVMLVLYVGVGHSDAGMGTGGAAPDRDDLGRGGGRPGERVAWGAQRSGRTA